MSLSEEFAMETAGMVDYDNTNQFHDDSDSIFLNDSKSPWHLLTNTPSIDQFSEDISTQLVSSDSQKSEKSIRDYKVDLLNPKNYLCVVDDTTETIVKIKSGLDPKLQKAFDQISEKKLTVSKNFFKKYGDLFLKHLRSERQLLLLDACVKDIHDKLSLKRFNAYLDGSKSIQTKDGNQISFQVLVQFLIEFSSKFDLENKLQLRGPRERVRKVIYKIIAQNLKLAFQTLKLRFNAGPLPAVKIKKIWPKVELVAERS